MTTASLKTFARTHTWLLRIGLITAVVIIGFQLISQMVLYWYLKLDYYLSLVALAFLAAGLLIRRTTQTEPRQNLPQNTPESLVSAETIATAIRPEPDTVTAPQPDLLTLLTSREYLVLRLLAEGKTNKEIAVAHAVEVSTVKTHINNIYTKLAVSNRAQARARYAEMVARMRFS